MERYLSIFKENCEVTKGWKEEDSMIRLEMRVYN